MTGDTGGAREEVRLTLELGEPVPDDIPSGELDEHQSQTLRDHAELMQQGGNVLFAQRQRECVQFYLEAIRLFQRIGARHEESRVANMLGNAYLDIPGLHDPDEAERWYQHAIQLLNEDETVDRARLFGALGGVAYDRFVAARAAGGRTPGFDYLSKALMLYQQALDLFPASAVRDLAIVHNQLGNVNNAGGNLQDALDHYQKSIQYDLSQGNLHGAGESRFNAALALAHGGRSKDALLYARAALRDYEAVGTGAAADAAEARRIITALEQDPPTGAQQ